MNLNKRQQLLAILAIVAVGFFVADKLVITPLTNSWKARTVRLAKLKNDVREGTETLKRETALREIRSDRIKLMTSRPKKNRIGPLRQDMRDGR